MRAIHCADLHLDSALNTNMDIEQSRRRRNELLNNFDRLIDYANENGVNVIIIAGDMFDMTTTSAKALDYVCDRIAHNGNINFFYCMGNHESADTFLGLDLPNLVVFNDRFTTYKYDNIAITGISCASCQQALTQLELDSNNINIVVAHGQLRKYASAQEDGIPLDLLRNKNIDYLALGHEHSYSHGDIDSRGQWCYCGCLEGRGFDESGDKGFVLLDIDRSVNYNFVPFAYRTLHRIYVDISSLIKFTDIENAINKSLLGISVNDMVEVILTGEVDENCQVDTTHLTQLVNDTFFFGRIKDCTSYAVNIAHYKDEISLRGMFIKCVLGSQLDQRKKDEIIKLGLSALSGRKEAL
ncbi:MAG: metallophosphoesterase [Clostridia bacterium]|nr:metallophosphoesterase [Clostridia bacterium]